MVVCAFPNAFFLSLFLNLNTESADRTRGFSKHWKIANNLTLFTKEGEKQKIYYL